MSAPKKIEVINASATQTEYPWRVTLRTFFQAFIPSAGLFLIAIPSIVSIIVEEFDKAGVVMPGWLYAVLTGLAVACGLVSAIIARVMAVPGIERWLRETIPFFSAAPSHPEMYKEDKYVSDDLKQ